MPQGHDLSRQSAPSVRLPIAFQHSAIDDGNEGFAMQPKCVGAIVGCLALGWGTGAMAEPAPAQPLAGAVEELIVEARGPRYTARTRRDRIGRVWVPVAINGRGPFRLLVDTGAQQTIGNDRLRKALLLRWRYTQDADIIGVTMDVTQAKSIRIPSIAFGSVKVRNAAISFGELPIFEHWHLNGEPALLLGMDVIEELETFEIDYQQRKLHLRPRVR